ncbi:ANTAR domain-containing protein [Kineococcus indalonis]|uniref:ANTAR domain-containing protein n=1 Tax=Kineococcus indalonis TaxID=2696566 RepID=UPI00141368DA|nr:ANTAR domain-containing protein [Kineococcus indalonis]NAZ87100.1 ANTAR domain-containing protein [Kineococcus indalonis]
MTPEQGAQQHAEGLRVVHSSPAPYDEDDLELRLQVVTEELAVADDELAAQQRQIEELLERETDARAALRALTLAVPVPVLTTDAHGAVRETNHAAAALLGVQPARLLRKPLPALVGAADRPAVRTLIATALHRGSAEGELVLTPRTGDPVRAGVVVTAVAAAGRPDARSLGWVLSPRTGAAAHESAAPGPRAAARAEDDEVLRAVAALTTLPLGEVGLHELLSRVAALATRAVRGASWSSVVLGDPAEPQEAAADSAQAQAADGAQWTARQGPCVDAYQQGRALTSSDLPADPRWPALGRHLAGSPVRSALALPVRLGEEVAGVLGVYGPAPGALGTEADLDRATVFAEAAGALLREARRAQELRATADNLKIAMRSRAVIEQAKGLVAGWLGCPVEEAFAAMTTLSQDRNVKLRDLAALVVADPSRRDLEQLLRSALERSRGRAHGSTSSGGAAGAGGAHRGAPGRPGALRPPGPAAP